MKRRKKNFRKRSFEEEDEVEGDGESGSGGGDKEGEKSEEKGESEKKRSDEARTASLQAVRAMQRMRGSKTYRDAQMEVRRHAEEGSTFEMGVTEDGRKIGLDTRENSKSDPQQPPRDITDHTQRMFVLSF